MSATGDLISALVSGGMDASEAAALVARAAVEMTGALTRKSTGASRQQRYRDRQKSSQSVTRYADENRNEASRTVTTLRCDEASRTVTNRNESVTSDAASLSIESKREEIRKEKRESRASQLLDDWTPSEKFWMEAIKLLGSEELALSELQSFRLHALDKGRVSKNWNAAWVKWALQAIKYGARNGKPNSDNRTNTGAGRATAREAEHVASVGSAALQYLRQGKSAGSNREASGDCGFTGVSHPYARAKGTH